MADFNEQERIARQLESVEGRYEELSIRITLPEVISDSALFTQLMREHAELEELNAIAVAYRKLREDIAAARELLEDAEMREMAKEELAELEPRLEAATQEARIALLPKDPDDRKNAILEVRAGAGGDEAGLFGAELLRMYSHYADQNGWKFEIIEDGSTELGGIKESVALIQGKNVFQKLKYESGVHRVQRVPVTESSGRIHTSTATVAVLPEAEDIEIEINQSDLEIETIALASVMHDIGKILVPNEILHKPGKLTDEEFAIMKTHPSNGYDILKEVDIMPDLALGAGFHHERMDGKGYPFGKTADEIPDVAQMIAVADTFDAMHSTRPYRKKMKMEDVIAELKRVAGTQLSEKYVNVLLSLIEEGKIGD